MYSKSHYLIAFLVSTALAFSVVAANAQTAPAAPPQTPPVAAPQTAPAAAPQTAPALTTPATPAPAQTSPATMGVLRGHILDQTGALIPGAQITVTTTKGVTVGTATASASGALCGARPAGRKLHRAGHVQRICAVCLRSPSIWPPDSRRAWTSRWRSRIRSSR